MSREFASTRSTLYRDQSPSQQHSSQAQADSDDDILDRMFKELSTDDSPTINEQRQSIESQNQASSDNGFKPMKFDRSNPFTEPNSEIARPQTSKTTQSLSKQPL